MSHATSTLPGGVVLDRRHAAIGPSVPCVLCQGLACCQAPVKDVPCCTGCAETRITVHATTPAQWARLTAAHTQSKGVV